MVGSGLVRSAIDFFLFGLGIKVLGFVRGILMARTFGVSEQTDAFYLALSVIFLFSQVVGGALTKQVVALLAKVEAREGRERKIVFLNEVLHLLFLICFFGVLILYFVAPGVLSFFGTQGVGGNGLTVTLFRIGLPTVVFYNLTSTLRGYLQSELMFRESALSLLPVNLVYIVYLLFFSRFGVKGMMVAQVAGVFLQFFLQAPALRRSGYRYRPRMCLDGPYTRELMVSFLPVFVAMTVGELNVLIDKKLASSLVVGSISALDISNIFNTTLSALFVSAVTVVLFPVIAKAVNEGRLDEASVMTGRGIRYALLIALPISLSLCFLARPVVDVFFGGGRFDGRAAAMTARALRWYGLGLFAQALVLFLVQIFYSAGRQRFIFWNSLFNLAFNFALSLGLMQFMAHGGLALGTSLSAMFYSLRLILALRSQTGITLHRGDGFAVGKISLAALLCAGGALACHPFFLSFFQGRSGGGLAALLLCGLTGMVIYLAALALLRSSEIREIGSYIRRRRTV